VTAFLRRQQRDWKVTVVRTSIDQLAYRLVYPYLSVYIVGLGATATQLGLVNSLGMVLAGVVAPFTGWLIDRYGPRLFYLAGIGMVGVSYLTYALAQSWPVTIVAMGAYWLGYSVSSHSCSTICGNCLPNSDRARGMTMCETFGGGLLGVAGPMLGAMVVATSGGRVEPESIRPLFIVGLVLTAVTFFVVLTQLSSRRWSTGLGRPQILRDLRDVMAKGRYLKRWLVIGAVGNLPLAMVLAFSQVYAHEVKGADTFVLAVMAAASALGSIMFSIPSGWLADRIGRKRVLYLTVPPFWLSNILLVVAPSPAFLVAAGALQSFFFVGGPVWAAMERELVPAEHMGRWIGIARMVRMIVSAGMALVAGFLWDHVGPASVFLGFVAIDALVRMPLLATMPETLRSLPGAMSAAADAG
jgi:MFS family permease